MAEHLYTVELLESWYLNKHDVIMSNVTVTDLPSWCVIITNDISVNIISIKWFIVFRAKSVSTTFMLYYVIYLRHWCLWVLILAKFCLLILVCINFSVHYIQNVYYAYKNIQVFTHSNSAFIMH